MGKKSGADNVILWSEELGIKLNENEVKEVLNQVKLRSLSLKRVLNKDEFRKIAENVRRHT
jgi:isopropylmalate/homocitrate/citramalate synthase